MPDVPHCRGWSSYGPLGDGLARPATTGLASRTAGLYNPLMQLPQRGRIAVLSVLATFGVMVAGAHAAPTRYAATADALPWVSSGWFNVNPSSATPGTTVQFEAVLNLTDSY